MSKLRKARSSRLALVAVVAAVGLGLSACQTAGTQAASGHTVAVELPPLSSLTPLADPADAEGPATAVIGGPSLKPVASNPKAELPVTVISDDGASKTEVTVTDTSRVLALSLSGTLAELVYAFGLEGNLVGKDVSTNVPGTEDLPVVTRSGHSIDAESVLSLSPTLLITDGSIGPKDVVLQLRDAGIPVVMVPRAVDPESTYETARQLAAALGIAPLADQLNDELKQAIAAKEEEVRALLPADASKRPRVAFLYIRGTSGVYYLFGEGSGIDSMIASLDAIDVAKEIGWKGEKPMTDEALVAANPDVILVMSKGLESAGGVDGLIAEKPSVALTNAGKNRRIIDADDTLLFAGGTRIPDVIDGLARAIYTQDPVSNAAQK